MFVAKHALSLHQKYLKEKLKINAVVFDDLRDKGMTIIEQLEYIGDHVLLFLCNCNAGRLRLFAR